MDIPKGHDRHYALLCWPARRGVGTPREIAAGDATALKAEADRLAAENAYAVIDLAYWSYELNDWVRMETFEGDESAAG